jgi:hypothetical protein
MSTYNIIDEPQVKPQAHLIINPIIIFFAAVFVPLFWNPPFAGSVWMPMVWLCINGYLLGSPTLGKEITYAISGIFCSLAIPVGFAVLFVLEVNWIPDAEVIEPYIRITTRATLYLFLYLVIFTQLVPYAIYNYLREQKST